MGSESNSPNIDEYNYKKFEQAYMVSQISISKNIDPNDYFNKLTDKRISYLKRYVSGKKVMDLCCGSGDFLFEIKPYIKQGVGVDFTQMSIDAALKKNQMINNSNIEFVRANAKELPFKSGDFDLVFSYSALASVPDVQDVIKEVSRVLKNEGIAILELGNKHSLNTFVCDACDHIAKHCHISLNEMKLALKTHGFKVMEWNSFGILPYWESKPAWLRPLLHPRWKKMLQKEVNGKMIDEYLSNFFILKPWSYRQFIICQKVA